MNMQDKTYLSICIPANGRIENLRNTLKSIYSDKNLSECNLLEFEVIVSDNNPDKTLEPLLKEFDYSNIHYFYSDCEGFMNSYYVLTYANGSFLKLHNSQEIFNIGALSLLINTVKSSIVSKPLIFFTSGLLQKGTVCEYENFNLFNYDLSYFSSWSNGFSIWKEDFEKQSDSISLNKIFPHTSIFLTQHFKKSYLINDQHLFTTQFIKKKGGYDKFRAFCIEYPLLIDSIYKNGFIELETKDKIFKDILYNYLPLVYFNVKISKIESVSSENFKQDIKVLYSKHAYWMVLLLSLFIPIKIIWRKIKINYIFKSNF
jgi:hypothetical protein